MTMLEALTRVFDDNRPQQDISQLVAAARTSGRAKHTPRSEAKNAFLRARGVDPEEAFPVLR